MKVATPAFAVLVLLSSCASQDPYTREGVWRPNGANETNLRAMIVDPDDLITGAADARADGQVVAAAVARYRSGKVRELSDASASKISPITINSGASTAPASDSE